jgi:hypothetical protein
MNETEAGPEWVRAADAARMLGLSRERVRQLMATGQLAGKREERRQVWVSVADITARLANRPPETGA